MCKLKMISEDVYVADIKYDYILNIISQAEKCKGINRIILFGSALGNRCKDDSDIDIAVFGNKDKNSYLKTKEFKEFHRNVFMYRSEVGQDYDILYFVEGKEYNDNIMNDIENGIAIYRKEAV